MFAVEFVADDRGRLLPIDLNTNCNYRQRSENAAGLDLEQCGVRATSRVLMRRASEAGMKLN